MKIQTGIAVVSALDYLPVLLAHGTSMISPSLLQHQWSHGTPPIIMIWARLTRSAAVVVDDSNMGTTRAVEVKYSEHLWHTSITATDWQKGRSLDI
jgi:hypothetical protein